MAEVGSPVPTLVAVPVTETPATGASAGASRVAWALASASLLLLLWLLAIWILHPQAYILPTPWDVIRRAWATRHMLVREGGPTILEIITGLLLSAAVGIPLGIVIVALPLLDRLVYPLLIAFNAVPKVALAPLFVVWFGYGLLPRVVVTVSIAFFPVLVSTITGLKSIDPEVLLLTRSMRARASRVFLQVRLPNALPGIFAGLKVATGLAVIGGIIGEFVASDEGWGYQLVQASGQLDTALMFAIVVLLAVFASLLFAIVTVIERATIFWHASHRQR